MSDVVNRKLSLVFIAVLVVSLVSGLQFMHIVAGFFDRIYLPEITINTDGSITPETNMISVSGNIYTLTGNIEGYSIVIKRSNIIFDGSGYTINATSGDSPGLKVVNVTGATIRDVNVHGRYTTVQVYISSDCQFIGIYADRGISLSDDCNSNNITKCTMQLLLIGHGVGANNNKITRNNITTELSVFGVNNIFSKNNFLLTKDPSIYTDNIWDDGAVGNYWGNNSDWRVNATEIDHTGVSDTPYVIQRSEYVSRNYPNATNVDNYPLLYPFDIENNAVYSPSPTPTNTQNSPTPTNTQNGGATPNTEIEPQSVVLAFLAGIAIAILVIATILIYRRKHN